MNRIIISLLVLILVSCNKEIDILPIQKPTTFEYQGFNLGIWNKDLISINKISELLDSMKNVGSNTVTIDFGVMIDSTGRVIKVPEKKEFDYTPKMVDIKSIINLAKNKGLKVVIKPHTITDKSTNNRMIYNTAKDTLIYNQNIILEWKNYLIGMIKDLEGSNFDVLCFGTEMDMVDGTRKDKWYDLIGAIRKVYSGKLTYDAVFNRWNGNPDVNEVEFWDKLDYIGVSLYVPLTKNPTPNGYELQNSWENGNRELGDIDNINKYLNDISIKFGKPIYVLETGYKSSINSLSNPSDLPIITDSPYYELQTLGFEILLKNLSSLENPSSKNKVINGVSIWGVNTTTNPYEKWDFITFNKPANVIIKKYFGVY